MGDREQSFPDVLMRRARQFPDDVAWRYFRPGQGWLPLSWAELWSNLERAACAFRAAGLKKGERLAILAPSNEKWELAHLGALLAGGVVVGIDASATPETVRFVLEHSGATFLVVNGARDLKRVPAEAIKRLKRIFAFETAFPSASPETVVDWNDAMRSTENHPLDRSDFPQPWDPATLIYTSGTTGKPKGVLYRHGQLFAAGNAILERLSEAPFHERTVSWLPLPNLFQRVVNLCALLAGGTIYFVENPADLTKQLRSIRPSMLIGVPRFYEKLQAALEDRLSHARGLKKWLTDWALRVGAAYRHAEREKRPIPRWLSAAHVLADWLVLRKIRAVVGGRMQFMLTGSAPTSPSVLAFFHSIGLLIVEAYGTSENVIPIAMNSPTDIRFGTVGHALRQNELKISDDGEILVRGPGLFEGYYGDHGGDRFTPDGFYKTGDVGEFDKDGFLRLRGRKDDVIKTSTGRKILPAPIEAIFGKIAGVDQAVVFGNGQKKLLGLMTLKPSAVSGDISSVRQILRREITERNRILAPYEQVWAWAILESSFTVEGGDLTPNFKLRRKHVEARHREILDRLREIPALQEKGPDGLIVLHSAEAQSHGRDAPFGAPPAQIRTFAVPLPWSKTGGRK